ncbi:LOW QUALITY PROTEIN: NEDD4-binding protein 2 [Thalassophryne amazonica]|uniref:LOW QUALITY PROTEIN: NEDD4-binding protein 2 n=1 Tax=Thalassophryne amazonica TaxID=390379 RepID=UPI0014715AE0|nr:LOW QUALITY PROTEIN: NEDD4-binding protein 2 [Thalassophryne amazonica]
MPRRKKNGQSPARVPGRPPDGGAVGFSTTASYGMASNFPSSTSVPDSVMEKITRSMQEMFSHLDPEIIDMVLSECDFKVENAMDTLLELSVTAEAPRTPVSGFEHTAATLLNPPCSDNKPDPDPPRTSQLSPPSLSSSLLSEELDLLVDQELQTLTTQPIINETENHNSPYLSAGAPLSSFPPAPFPQRVLPELLQSSVEPESRGPSADEPCLVGGLAAQTFGSSSPIDQLSSWGEETTEVQQSVVDFTHLTTKMSVDKPKSPLDLAASGRPSAFHIYKKKDQSHSPEETGILPPEGIVGGTTSMVGVPSQEPVGCVPLSWNLDAPEFHSQIHGKRGPSFIMPVAHPHSVWTGEVRHASPWLNQCHILQVPSQISAPVLNPWLLPAPPGLPTPQNRLHLEGKVLVLLRGVPGSGKSTLARAMLLHNPGGVILSTDDYFSLNRGYHFNPTLLGEAHEWNQKRAKEAFEKGLNPIIIDNTNLQGWEMKPYVTQALQHKYKVLFREPDTWWKNKPRELERRSTHNVPVETIRLMLNKYERFVTVQSIMGSQMPEWKHHLSESRNSQLVSPEKPCPDLVGHPALTEECKKSRSQLFSSLPDVSSIGGLLELDRLQQSSYNSAESLNFHPCEMPLDNPEIQNEDGGTDLGALNSKLDNQLQLSYPRQDKGIPDCIVESVLTEEHCGDELPVAFSESIGQRVRRKPSRRADLGSLESADLLKDTNQTEKEGDGKRNFKEAEGVELVSDGSIKLSDFVGDWPSEAPLRQRELRKREINQQQNEEDGGEVTQEADFTENENSVQSDHDKTEFQKLLDLIQTGVTTIQTSHDSPVSTNHGEKLDGEDGNGFEVQSKSPDSEDGEQINKFTNSGRAELPDCVLDWSTPKPGMIWECSHSGMDDGEQLQIENEETRNIRTSTPVFLSGIKADSGNLELPNSATSVSAIAVHSLAVLESVETEVHHDEGRNQNLRDEVAPELGLGHAEEDTKDCAETTPLTDSITETGGNHIDDHCQTERPVEAENNSFSGSQERKLRLGRRSGKLCKLALTFSHNCIDSSLNSLNDDPTAIAPDQNNTMECLNTSVEPSFNSNHKPSLDPKPNVEMYIEALPSTDTEAHQHPRSPFPLTETGCQTQTEPKDFAVLWHLNNNSTEEMGITVYSQPCDITVLSGNSSRFVPEICANSTAAAVHQSDHKGVPYSVMLEKGTQVEEKELEAPQDRPKNLNILKCHFKEVSIDTLEDLYDKCHQDLEWTTNLLLDSGERFFRGEDDEEDVTMDEDEQGRSDMSGTLMVVDTRSSSKVVDEHHSEDQPVDRTADFVNVTQGLTSGTGGDSGETANHTDLLSFEGTESTCTNKVIKSEKSPQEKLGSLKPVKEGKSCNETEGSVSSESGLVIGACGKRLDDSVKFEEPRVDTEEATMDLIQRLLQDQLEELEREGAQNSERERIERTHLKDGSSRHLNIQSVELKLPTELALQLTELFGPVGVDTGTCTTEDYIVKMDLNLAKMLHQKWKETIQEKQRRATRSCNLVQQSSLQSGVTDGQQQPWRHTQPLMVTGMCPTHTWSLRNIMKEEQVMHENMEKVRQSRADVDRRQGATLLKEKELYSLFPNIDRNFLQDIFKDHNYSLTQTELFLRSLLDEEPVKTVVAPEATRSDHQRATSKEGNTKSVESAVDSYQDTKDPAYDDFRAEASLQRSRQLESLDKAAEAYKQGHKEVASFYAQQAHLHGQRMREANHRAALHIFQMTNSSLLPRNILDLHGLHVKEALQTLAQVLEDKVSECEQGLCQPQLSVITGKGNHSQGGVARIRPAVKDYLTNKHYRFTEPELGLILVSLK